MVNKLYFGQGQRTNKNPRFVKVYSLYKTMMARCYNQNSKSYQNYGALGVSVCNRWHNFDNFANDIELIEGYDENSFFNDYIQLDKDIKQQHLPIGKRVYSLETCKFVSASDNCGCRKNNKEMIIISPYGEKFVETNREKFCREHNIDTRHAYNCLIGKSKHYKGWQFFYKNKFKEEDVLYPQIILGIDPLGVRYVFNNIAKFAKEYNLCSANISMVISGKNKHHKNWTFFKKREGFIIQ